MQTRRESLKEYVGEKMESLKQTLLDGNAVSTFDDICPIPLSSLASP